MDSVQIIEQATNRMAVIDLESKLLQNNIIFVTKVIDADSVATYQAELFYLTSKMTPKESEKSPIKIYINSPGGDCYSFLGLYDIIQTFIKQGYVIETCNIGLAASAAAYLLLSGSKGHRFCTANSTVMLHQPSSDPGYLTVTDQEIDYQEGKRIKEALIDIVKKHASEEIVPMLERDKWMSAQEAISLNIIDAIK